MAKHKLEGQALEEAVAKLDGWSVQDGKLSKQFKFDSFAQALGWMVSVGVQADKMGHHPDWSNVYNKVSVELSTHDLGGAISNLDIELAEKMDALR